MVLRPEGSGPRGAAHTPPRTPRARSALRRCRRPDLVKDLGPWGRGQRRTQPPFGQNCVAQGRCGGTGRSHPSPEHDHADPRAAAPGHDTSFVGRAAGEIADGAHAPGLGVMDAPPGRQDPPSRGPPSRIRLRLTGVVRLCRSPPSSAPSRGRSPRRGRAASRRRGRAALSAAIRQSRAIRGDCRPEGSAVHAASHAGTATTHVAATTAITKARTDLIAIPVATMIQ